ncbi:MAG: radical SAM protein [Candidatus Omnitrophota bacterium]
MSTHYTIPFFVLHKGCPFRCIFCDQKNITGQEGDLPSDIAKTIDKYLKTIDAKDADIEVGFFGGTFTGIDPEKQLEYLRPVKTYIEKGIVKGIRLSTRPDFIDEKKLKLLKSNGVVCIELGVQSVSDKVLSAAKRGYAFQDIKTASKMIKDLGFDLVHQIMLGLPLSTWEDEYLSARIAKDMGAKEARIYPTVVIKGTELADRWQKKEYVPLTEKEAVKRSAKLILYFETNGIKVIRCGLHPSRDLLSGESILDGPFHTAFRLKAESLIFRFMLEHIGSKIGEKRTEVKLFYSPRDEAAFYGFEKKNMSLIEKICGTKRSMTGKDDSLARGNILVISNGEKWIVTREDIVSFVLQELKGHPPLLS